MSARPESESDAPGRLEAMFKGRDPSSNKNHWHKLWDEKHTPWDRGQASPALIEVLQDRKDLVRASFVVDPAFGTRRKQALVPGCGRGYDVLLLSAFGYDAYGLDISEIGIREAKEYQNDHFEDEVYKARGPEGRGKVTWGVGDFFKDEFLKEFAGEATFDLIYDYTFLSALPPSMRAAWAFRTAQLLSPAGVFICVEWPSEKVLKAGGPPWPLPPQVYLNHLTRPGKDLEYGRDGNFLEDKLGPQSKDGLERIAHFHPKQTHGAGKSDDGRITDWVSVWKHKPTA